MVNFFYPNFFCRGHTTNHDTRGQKVGFYHFPNTRLPPKLFELKQLRKDEQGNRGKITVLHAYIQLIQLYYNLFIIKQQKKISSIVR